MRSVEFGLDESTHKKLKNLARAQRRSMSSLVRDALDQYLGEPSPRKTSIKDPSSTPSANSQTEGFKLAG